MENETQFDLEVAIRKWRDSLLQSSRLRAEELEELELHLRDSVSVLQKRGLSEDEAWLIAQRRFGQREALKKEFAKVASPTRVLTSRWERFIAATQNPEPTGPVILRRIILMERDIVLPAKIVAIGMLLFSFYSSPWFTTVSSEFEIGVEVVQNLLWAYVVINLLVAVILLFARRVPLRLLEWMVFAMTLLDGVFILSMTIALGAEGMYWLFPALLVRAAFSVPRLSSQILLSLTLIVCYAFASVVENSLAHNLQDLARPLLREAETQSMALRLVLLISIAACCYGMQILLSRTQFRSTPVAD